MPITLSSLESTVHLKGVGIALVELHDDVEDSQQEEGESEDPSQQRVGRPAREVVEHL